LYFERNLSGYFTSEPSQWHGVQRILIDKTVGSALGDWTLMAPELVYTAGPSAVAPRPDSDPYQRPSPEIVTAGGQFLNADQCATTYYAPHADGITMASSDLWQACIAPDLLAHGNAESWQSPDSYLFSRRGKRHYDIYRVYVSDGLADTEELLIENARFADTGL
jgi:hypothetical protein